MPSIREFDAPQLQIRPNEAGTDAAAQAGRRIGAFYHQMGQDIGGSVQKLGDAYEEHQATQEISHGLASYAQGLNGLSQQWNATAKSADPNDPTIGQQFHDGTVQPWIEQWQSSFKTEAGKKWAATKAGELQQHMYEKTAADMSTLAGDAAITNMETAKNNFSQLVMNDPSSHDMAQQAWRDSVEAMIQHNPNLTADAAAKLRQHYLTEGGQEIAKGTVYGVAGNNPQLARTMLASGKFGNYLDADQVKSLDGYAQTVQRANDEAQKAAVAAQRKQEDDDFKGSLNKVQLSLVQPDGSILPSPSFYKDVLALSTMPGAGRNPGEIKSLVDMAAAAREHQINHTFVSSDPQTYITLSKRVGLPVTAGGLTPAEVNTAYAQGRLSDHDFSKLHEEIQKGDKENDPAQKELTRRRTEFLESIKTQMGQTGPLGSFLKPEAAARFYAFQQDTENREDALKAAGKTPAEIMATIYNPRDAAYQGARVSAYSLSTKEGLAAATASAKGAPLYTPAPSLSATTEAGIKNAPAPAQPNANAFNKLSPAQQEWIKAHQ